jgi:hypothetical protein
MDIDTPCQASYISVSPNMVGTVRRSSSVLGRSGGSSRGSSRGECGGGDSASGKALMLAISCRAMLHGMPDCRMETLATKTMRRITESSRARIDALVVLLPLVLVPASS